MTVDNWRITHGQSKTAINNCWYNMMHRCYNPKNRAYSNYGGRGIKVCARWHNFENFYEDLGDAPLGMHLDRINNDGNYEPDNVRWVTRRENSRNRRTNLVLTIDGVSKTLVEWVEDDMCVAPSYHAVYRRLKRGWEPKRALTTF